MRCYRFIDGLRGLTEALLSVQARPPHRMGEVMNKPLALTVAAVIGLGSFTVTSNDAEAFYRRGYGGHFHGGGYYGGGGAIAAGIIGGLALGALAAPAYAYNRGYYGSNYYYDGYCYPTTVYYNTPAYYGGYYGLPHVVRSYYGRRIVRPYAYYGRRAYYRPIRYYGRPVARYYGRRW